MLSILLFFALPLRSLTQDVNSTQLGITSGWANGYSESCIDIRAEGIYADASLVASCPSTDAADATFRTTSLPFKGCLGNSNGVLGGSQQGNYYKTCRYYTFIAPTTFEASCADMQGNLVNSSVWLDQYIGNDGGYLRCWDIKGTLVSEQGVPHRPQGQPTTGDGVGAPGAMNNVTLLAPTATHVSAPAIPQQTFNLTDPSPLG